MTAELTREELVGKLRRALDLLEQLITEHSDEPAKQSHMVGRYAETLVRAIATLYPPKQQVELSKAPTVDLENNRDYLEAVKLEVEARLAALPPDRALPAKKTPVG